MNGDRTRSGRGNPTAGRTLEREKRGTCQIVRLDERIHHVVDATMRLIEGADLTMEATGATKAAVLRTKQACSLHEGPVPSRTGSGFHTASIVRGMLCSR